MALHLLTDCRVWWDDDREVMIVTDYESWIPGRAIMGVVDETQPTCIGCGSPITDTDHWPRFDTELAIGVCPNCCGHVDRFDDGDRTFGGDEIGP